MNRQEFLKRYKRRGYLHFDTVLPHGNAAWRIVERFQQGDYRGFLPFLGFDLVTNRIRRVRPDIEPCPPRSTWAIELRPKKRQIKIASHADAAIYSYYGHILSIQYERELQRRGLSAVPTAFRKVGQGKCNIHHANEVFDFIESNRPCIALGFDVEKFFDRLSHRKLFQCWAAIIGSDRLPLDHFRVYQSLTRFTWVSRKRVYQEFGISEKNPRKERSPNPRLSICSPTEFREHVRNNGLLQPNTSRNMHGHLCGIPQGSPMSAVLSNIYMLEVDTALTQWAAETGGLYRRYCDDIMLVVPPTYADESIQYVETLLQEHDLAINSDKTERVEFSSVPLSTATSGGGLPYLGFVYDGSKVYLRQSSLDRYYGKMRRGVRFAALCWAKAARNSPEIPLKSRKILLKYSHLARTQRGGRRIKKKLGKERYQRNRTNFVTYALRAATEMESPTIRKQIRGHWRKVHRQLRKCSE